MHEIFGIKIPENRDFNSERTERILLALSKQSDATLLLLEQIRDELILNRTAMEVVMSRVEKKKMDSKKD